jgi:hypothetical protein
MRDDETIYVTSAYVIQHVKSYLWWLTQAFWPALELLGGDIALEKKSFGSDTVNLGPRAAILVEGW